MSEKLRIPFSPACPWRKTIRGYDEWMCGISDKCCRGTVCALAVKALICNLAQMEQRVQELDTENTAYEDRLLEHQAQDQKYEDRIAELEAVVAKLRLERDMLALNRDPRDSSVLTVVGEDGNVQRVLWPVIQSASQPVIVIPPWYIAVIAAAEAAGEEAPK